jgi:hypothetical protein
MCPHPIRSCRLNWSGRSRLLGTRVVGVHLTGSVALNPQRPGSAGMDPAPVPPCHVPLRRPDLIRRVRRAPPDAGVVGPGAAELQYAGRRARSDRDARRDLWVDVDGRRRVVPLVRAAVHVGSTRTSEMTVYPVGTPAGR